MGADSEYAEQWLDLLQIIAAADADGDDKYIEIIGMLAEMSSDTGENCKEILDDFDEKLSAEGYYYEEIQKTRIQLDQLKKEYQGESEICNKLITDLKHELNQVQEACDRKKIPEAIVNMFADM